MIEPSGERVRWNVGRGRIRRRPGTDAAVVATNGSAMLVHVLEPDRLEIGMQVDVAFEAGTGTVEVRHVAPTGRDGSVLVGVELVAADEALEEHLAQRARASREQGPRDRWWWQSGEPCGGAPSATDT
jgi:hypothetical protein